MALMGQPRLGIEERAVESTNHQLRFAQYAAPDSGATQTASYPEHTHDQLKHQINAHMHGKEDGTHRRPLPVNC